MVFVHCAFEKCGNKRKKINNTISFFSFPKDTQLLKRWFEFINKHNKKKLDETNLHRDRMKICHLHFERNQIMVKSNNDRALIRFSVPCFPPGVVDSAYIRKKSKKSKKKSKSPKVTTSAPISQPIRYEELQKKSSEDSPLLHNINGYEIDLRVASQQNFFRLPNGKLIQVRRQAKKNQVTKPPSGQSVAQERPKPSRTYANKRIADSQAASGAGAGVSRYATQTTLTPPPRTLPPPDYPTIATMAMPALTALQALMHKSHEETTFGNCQKRFEDRLISAAEIALHVVSKVNNLINSNPFKTAASERDIKELYIHVSYVLKYAVDRFKNLEDNCVNDVKGMGFTKNSDLGPMLDEQNDKNKQIDEDKEKEDDDDDDCAIVEQRADLIEIFSDDDEDKCSSDEEQKTSKLNAIDTPEIKLDVTNVKICSDTESIHEEEEPENTDDQTPKETVVGNSDAYTIAGYEITESPDETRQDDVPNVTSFDAVNQVELVMKHEIEETTTEITHVVESYFHSETGEQDESMEMQSESHHGFENGYDDDEMKQMDDNEQEGEETEELIEIIEGDVDLDDGHEYKVIEIVDGEVLFNND